MPCSAKHRPLGITWELSANDKALDQLLDLAGRPDLIPTLGNIFALPYGKWPRDPAGETAIQNYTIHPVCRCRQSWTLTMCTGRSTCSRPTRAEFLRWDVPRIVATVDAVQYFSKNAANAPIAHDCRLESLDPSRISDPLYVAGEIDRAIQAKSCPPGIYATDKYVFRAVASPGRINS